MSSLFINPVGPIDNLVGLPSGAATVTFYLTGTTTLVPIYNADGTTLPNPISADAFGRLPQIYLDETIVYRIRVQDRFGVLLPPEIDPYSPGASGSFVNQRTLFIPSGAGGVSRPVTVKLADEMQNPRDRGAVGDSTTDDRAAFAACDALGPMRVTQGVYRIASSIAFTNKVTFEPGAKIIITSGVVTFNGGCEGPDELIFIIAGGTVAGLTWAKEIWFDGDVATNFGSLSATTCDTRLQAAFNSLRAGGVLYGDPRYRRKGSSSINMAAASYEGNGVNFAWDGTAAEGFTASPSTVATFLRNVNFAPSVAGTIPASGTALVVNRSQLSVDGLSVTDGFQGIDVAGGVSNHYYSVHLNGCVNFGIRSRAIDQFFHGGEISSPNDWVGLTSITGTFNVGDAISITGSVGNISANYTAAYSGRYRIFFNDALPTAGMTITSSSGGSATIGSIVLGHQAGGVRLEPTSNTDVLEANTFENLDVIGGSFSLLIINAAGGVGRYGHAAFNRFAASVYFDTPYNGAMIDGAYGCVVDAWFSNSRVKDKFGAYFNNCGHTRIGGHFVANSGQGIVLDATCIHTTIERADFDGNCRDYSDATNMADIYLAGAIQRVTITNVTVGFAGVNGVTPPKGIKTDATASDYLKFGFIQCGGGGITWGSTGTHNRRVAVDSLTDI